MEGEMIVREGEETTTEESGKDKMKFLFDKRFLFALIAIIILLILAWHTRTANVPALKDVTTNKYALGPDLDPFLFFRYAKYIVENGKLMEHDNMRYVPLGYNPSSGTGTIVLPYMIAYFHKFLSLFSNVSVEYSAIMFPVFMFMLSVIVFFLFVRKVFEKHKYKEIIALISCLFLIVSPSLLPRTVAGIPEKEGAGFFFMFLVFYLFLSAWKSGSFKKRLVLVFSASLSNAILSLIWGGWIYVFITVALFVFVEFILGKIEKKKLIIYSSWFFLNFLLRLLLIKKITLQGLIFSSTTGSSLVIFSLLLVDFLIFETRIKNLDFIQKLRKKIPDRFISLIFCLVIGIVFSIILFGFSFIQYFVGEIFSLLINPYSDRLSFTVAENSQPYFTGWSESFGPIVKGMPLLFWLFFIGSIFLFYDSIKKIEKKGRIMLTFSYVVFLFALIFSRYSSNSVMNGVSSMSKMVYLLGFLLMVASSCYLFYKYYKQNNLEEFKKANSSYLFLIVFFLIGLIGARGAVRLIMVLSIPVAIIIGYFSMAIISRVRKEKGKTLKLVFIVIAIIISIATLYSFYSNYQSTLAQTRAMIPSMYTQQWQKAMAWVRDYTPENAVFAHWWDYGYWVQSIGNRATILDGGNSIAYWDHLLGRHVLTGQSEKEALEFLYAHNATYLLIDSTEIGKYTAYSSIGSDENYDRYSQISTFEEDENSMQELKNETIHLYRGSMFVDEDYWWEENGNQEVFSAYKAGIGGVILSISNDGKVKQPEAVFIYQGKQTAIPMRYIYFQNKFYDFGSGYGGCLYMVPKLIGGGIKNIGQGLFLTEKTMRALWVKLYLFDEGENFKLVHKEENFVVRQLRNQIANIGDFVFYGGFQGPIKIWKINYPEDIEFKKEYLETAYPESIRIAKGFF